MLKKPPAAAVHTRRPRYPGKNPRAFHDKYKELDPERYASEVQKILASGRTPAGSHRPIMVEEVLRCLQPAPGDIAVDCTLGGGGHALAILERVQPGGRLIGLDVDPFELPRAEARLRDAGFGPESCVVRQGNFAGLPQALADEGVTAANLIFADLGVSSMQIDNPDRGFSYKGVGPLDMRMNPSHGEPASQLLARISEEKLARLLTEHADEPHAALIARLLKQKPLTTTHAVERVVRMGLSEALPKAGKADIKMSVRRTFQALRIAVNDEFSALDALLRWLPHCLAPGGRAAVITFHSGEDRRVKKSFQAGRRDGLYSSVADDVIRSSKEETFANRRASAAKLRWAVRALNLLAIAILWATPAFAQLVEPNQVGVRMGHIHLAVKDVDAQKQFWTSVMGGTLVKNGPLELIQFPGAFIMLQKAEPVGPPAGSIVNHFGFTVKDMPAALARWKAADVRIQPTENPNEVYVLAPDGIRVEVYGEPALPTAVSMNHIHFLPADIPAIKAWYVKAFGANPGRRPCVACLSKPTMIEADDLPGVNLSFSPGSETPLPTKGRSLDHIGFEVTNLDAFVASLEAKGIHIEAPIRQVPGTRLKMAFLTDPWGTYIELTEGLTPE